MTEEKKSPLTLKQKLLNVRVELAGVTQSGKNDHSHYSYFELSDFMPKINKLNAEYGIFSVISFDKEFAKLTLVNADNEQDEIIITSPMAGAKLPSCHEIQNLGAVESYQRRYLYMTAYEITEPDKLEQNDAEPTPPTEQKSEQEIIKELTAEWSKCRTRLGTLGKNVRSPKTNNYICTKAEVETQEIEKLSIEDLKSLVNTYHEMITTMTGGK